MVEYFNSITHLPVAFLTACPATAEAAQAIRAIADGVGFSHTSSAASAACVERAHAAGLLVHVYTRLSDPVAHEKMHSWGVDGVFGNHPDVTKAVRDAYYPLTATGFLPPVGAATVVQDPEQPEPLADAATTWHRVRAGSAVPLRFNVFNEGTNVELVTMMGAVDRVRVFTVPGCSGAVGAELPYADLATEDGGLRYDAVAGHFALTWKTPRISGEACYRVTFSARDGSALHAFVRTTR